MGANSSKFRDHLFSAITSRGTQPTIISLVDGFSLTGDEIGLLVDRGVAILQKRGLAAGDRILLKLPNGAALALAYLICLRGRFVAVPVSPEIPGPDLDYVVEIARPEAIIGSEENFLAIKALRAADAATTKPIDYAADDLFCIAMTSGTTSRPKAGAHLAERMLANAAAFADVSGFGAGTRMSHVMPMFYMAGILNTILCSLIAGGSVILHAAFSPQSALGFWRALEDNATNAIWLSPTMLQMAMKLDRRPAEKTRFVPPAIYVGTAPLPNAVAKTFEATYAVPALQSYGLSELLLISSEQPDKRGGVGRVLPGIELAFASDGEVEVKTSYGFAGYLDAQSGRLDPVTQGFVPTGDLAGLSSDGVLTITGRKKDLIIVGGMNVSPVSVEHVLSEHEAVDAIAVKGVPDTILGEKVVAFVALRAGRSEQEAKASLNALAASRLPNSARPSQYVFCATLPTGPTGKVQKHLLKVDGQS